MIEILPREDCADKDELCEREQRIERAQRNAYYEIGLELRSIRERRLYRANFATFEEYCESRWEMSPQRCGQLIAAAAVAHEMETKVSTVPAKESHVAPLLRLGNDDERASVWRAVLDAHPDGHITTKDVDAAVHRFIAAKEKNWLTLGEWEALGKADQKAAFEPMPNDKTMNRQDNTSIEWAQWSWNPVTGCRHDCPYCYARDIAERFYPPKFEPSFWPERLRMPQNTPVPALAEQDIAHRNVFTCSMADLFGRWVPSAWIETVLRVVQDNPQWNFLFLTKFPKRMAEFEFPANAWLGTTVDLQMRVKPAQDAFSRITGGTRWLSLEPLLEPLKFDRLDLFNWVVIGGASRSTQTPEFHPPLEWLWSVHAQARAAGCRIYYKDNAGLHDDIRLREFPWQEPEQIHAAPSVFAYLKKVERQ